MDVTEEPDSGTEFKPQVVTMTLAPAVTSFLLLVTQEHSYSVPLQVSSLDKQAEEGEFLAGVGQTGAKPSSSCFLPAGLFSSFPLSQPSIQADVI